MARIEYENGVFWTLVLDEGKGGDDAGYPYIQAFYNAGKSITLMLLDGDDQPFNEGGPYSGAAMFCLTPEEARLLGRQLLTQADEAVSPAATPTEEAAHVGDDGPPTR